MSASAWADEMWLVEGVMTRRVVAWLIDTMLVALLCTALTFVLLLFGLMTLGLGLPLLGTVSLVPLLYSWMWVASPAQATPGQALCGLRVVRNDDLGRPNAAQALVYALGYLLTMAAGVVWLAVALLTDRHRALHDLASGLAVVRGRAVPTLALGRFGSGSLSR